MKSLTAKHSAERLAASAIWSRENSRFVDIVYEASPSFFIHYKCGVPILRGCSGTIIRFRKFKSSNSRLELALAASVVLSERIVAENSCSWFFAAVG